MPNESLHETLNRILSWSGPTQIMNSRGLRLVRRAPANSAFWALWRTSKADIRALNYACEMSADNSYTVIQYMDPAVIEPAQVVPPPPTPSIQPDPVLPVTTSVQWSDEQLAIFRWFQTPTSNRSLVVRARAGTGKTTTIKAAFACAPEDRMLYAVFNKKNQVEASGAIDDPRVDVKTLHSLGLMFIRSVWPSSRANDEVEKDRVKAVCDHWDGAAFLAPSEVHTQVRKLVGFAKNAAVNPTVDELIELAELRDIECPQFSSPSNGGWDVAKLAQAALRVLDLSTTPDSENRVSFNDMVWLPIRMGWVRGWYDLVVVDEAQDMNVPQLLMAKGARKSNGRICVVGDDRQAIYGFRGAASDGLNMMVQELAACELGLTITYRCPKSVVALASALVPDYRAADTAPDGLVERRADMDGVVVGDAILSRSNAPLLPICMSLLRRGIRARIEGKDVGRELLEIIKKLNATSVPVYLARVETWRQKQVARYMDTRLAEEKCAKVNDMSLMLVSLADGASGVSEIISRTESMFKDSSDPRDPEARLPRVTLSSVHKAKGLEWGKVWLLSRTFNRKRPVTAAPLSPEAELARAKEEANIYYVALTRAKQHLVLADVQI